MTVAKPESLILIGCKCAYCLRSGVEMGASSSVRRGDPRVTLPSGTGPETLHLIRAVLTGQNPLPTAKSSLEGPNFPRSCSKVGIFYWPSLFCVNNNSACLLHGQ